MYDIKIFDQGDDTQLVKVFVNNQPATFKSVLSLLATSKNFRAFFDNILGMVSFEACFWECPPLTLSTVETHCQFVLINAPALANQTPNWHPFKEHIAHCTNNDNVTDFYNLGRDATLIVPCPISTQDKYTHLLSFMRNAPEQQKDNFWKQVGDITLKNVSEKPLWLSTAGMGVSWLHVRLCNTPKYYRYDPFKLLKTNKEENT